MASKTAGLKFKNMTNSGAITKLIVTANENDAAEITTVGNVARHGKGDLNKVFLLLT